MLQVWLQGYVVQISRQIIAVGTATNYTLRISGTTGEVNNHHHRIVINRFGYKWISFPMQIVASVFHPSIVHTHTCLPFI